MTKKYYKKEYFDLLEEFGGLKRVAGNPKHDRAYQELKAAYGLTKQWANMLKEKHFPDGIVKVVRKPTNQANKFETYNWARIYPTKNSPKELAYTVGMSARGFAIKIDTVHEPESSKTRAKYEKIRGVSDNDSPILSRLPVEDGLKLSLDELVDWSVKEIEKFGVPYNNIAEQLGLSNVINEPIENNYSNNQRSEDYRMSKSVKFKEIPLNQILYGPPGTGKTYSTINKALEILDPAFLQESDLDRATVKQRFDELKEQGRVSFVTFHQSFAYEDFVEGLKADSEGDSIQYFVEPGIFKSICDKADTNQSSSSLDEAIERLMEKASQAEVVMKTATGLEFGVTYRGGRTFRIKPFSSDKGVDYPANIDSVRSIYRGADSSKVYNPSYVKGILEYLRQEYALGIDSNTGNESKPYVLIIDEINRGNIASIFGELISLVEDSKRKGRPEALEVKLPYSKELISVPENLYIIGTMNTADKSLAQVDVALRRRFSFEEMMPKPKILEKLESIDGIEVAQLLKVINQRIELLYDREHTVGHSFFLPLTKEPTLDKLAHIFETQIMPLLEEYFFEDWEKIRQVLGDHLKSNSTECFIQPKYSDSDISKLMGDDWELDGITSFERNPNAFTNPQAYIGIYSSSKE